MQLDPAHGPDIRGGSMAAEDVFRSMGFTEHLSERSKSVSMI